MVSKHALQCFNCNCVFFSPWFEEKMFASKFTTVLTLMTGITQWLWSGFCSEININLFKILWPLHHFPFFLLKKKVASFSLIVQDVEWIPLNKLQPSFFFQDKWSDWQFRKQVILYSSLHGSWTFFWQQFYDFRLPNEDFTGTHDLEGLHIGLEKHRRAQWQ